MGSIQETRFETATDFLFQQLKYMRQNSELYKMFLISIEIRNTKNDIPVFFVCNLEYYDMSLNEKRSRIFNIRGNQRNLDINENAGFDLLKDIEVIFNKFSFYESFRSKNEICFLNFEWLFSENNLSDIKHNLAVMPTTFVRSMPNVDFMIFLFPTIEGEGNIKSYSTAYGASFHIRFSYDSIEKNFENIPEKFWDIFSKIIYECICLDENSDKQNNSEIMTKHLVDMGRKFIKYFPEVFKKRFTDNELLLLEVL